VDVKLKKSSIPYTQRDFTSIKEGLVDFAKRYYPDTINDFSQPSFNSLMLDTVAYVGDILSFYLDYQANESFLATASEASNIIKHARDLSYPLKGRPVSFGQVAVFIEVPADSSGGIDTSFLPIVKSGTTFVGGRAGEFTLSEDIDFRKDNVTALVSKVDSTTGLPTFFVMKAYGQVVSGIKVRKSFILGDAVKFLRLELPEGSLVSSIDSIVDEAGHIYYEVENLTQNVVYAQELNTGTDKSRVSYKMKRVAAPRRFVSEYTNNRCFLRFGAGSGVKITDDVVNEPRNVLLQQDGRDYISSTTFDPTKLVDTDKFGISPANTTLYVRYKVNTSTTTNAAAGQVTQVATVTMDFPDDTTSNETTQNVVIQSIEVTNEDRIVGDTTGEDKDELKTRVMAHYASQNRAITKEDYIATVYKMDPRFGSIKRCNVVRDFDSDRRNINIYLVATDSRGHLAAPTTTLKTNLQNWLLGYKPINDSVDLLDGRIINYGVDYKIIIDDNYDKNEVVAQANRILGDKLGVVINFGQSLFLGSIFRDLVIKVEGLLDVVEIEIVNKVGGFYSSSYFDIEANLSRDGRYLNVPENSILELKFPEQDIRGAVI
jgi:hypothetical protein